MTRAENGAGWSGRSEGRGRGEVSRGSGGGGPPSPAGEGKRVGRVTFSHL